MSKKRRSWDNDVEFGEDSDGDASDVEVEVEVQEAATAEVSVGTDDGYDPYYDEPVPRGSGGSFVKRDGKRYRARP